MRPLEELAGQFDIVLIDPPWPMYGDPNKNAAAGKHYNLMTLDEICNLPIRSLLRSKYGAVFCWVTCPRADLGFQALARWGLHFRGIPFIWAKTREDGELIGAQGVPPTSTKPTTELCLLGTTNPRGRPFPLLSSKVRQLVQHPRGRHSEKPAVVRDRIVELYGDRPRLEMFARQQASGWVSWGNEISDLGESVAGA